MGSSICGRFANWVIPFFGIILFGSSSFALDCSQVNSKEIEICNQIIQSNATSTIKEKMIADLIYPYRNFANNSLVYERNHDISFNTAPFDAKTLDSEYIKDAWIKIISINPSIINDGKLLTSGKGEVLTRHNYRIQIPQATEQGDCKTEYKIMNEDSNLDIFLNNNLIGHEDITSFNGFGALNFVSELDLKAQVQVKHYKIFKWCCEQGKNGCLKFCEECKFDNWQTRTDSLNLQDEKQALHYSPVIKYNIKSVDSYLNTTVGILDITDFDSFEISFQDSYFRQFNYFYDVNVSLRPYDVLTLRANNFTHKEFSNINVIQSNNSYKFYVPNANGCKIKFSTHFNSWQENCLLTQEFLPFGITTDKQIYGENEAIFVSIKPKDTLVFVEYANERKLAKDSVQFLASPGFNKISANVDNRYSEKIIYVKDKSTINFILSFAAFFGVMYFLYSLIKNILCKNG